MNKTIAQQLNITKFPFIIKDEKGNEIYLETSTGYWRKYQFDEKGNRVYYEDSTGYWTKSQYDEKDNEVYYEDSTGYWIKRQYDEKGNEIYLETSKGKIIDNRPKQTVEIKLDEIAKALNIPVNQLKIKK
jgi:hypothetical protein